MHCSSVNSAPSAEFNTVKASWNNAPTQACSSHVESASSPHGDRAAPQQQRASSGETFAFALPSALHHGQSWLPCTKAVEFWCKTSMGKQNIRHVSFRPLPSSQNTSNMEEVQEENQISTQGYRRVHIARIAFWLGQSSHLLIITQTRSAARPQSHILILLVLPGMGSTAFAHSISCHLQGYCSTWQWVRREPQGVQGLSRHRAEDWRPCWQGTSKWLQGISASLVVSSSQPAVTTYSDPTPWEVGMGGHVMRLI